MQLLFPVLYMAAIAAALPSQQCAGSLQCCRQIENIESRQIQLLLGLLGITSADLSGGIGLNCFPTSAIDVTCDQQLACCTGKDYEGLIVSDRAPVGEYNNLVYGLQANYASNKEGLSDLRKATLTIPMLAEITGDICFYEEGGS
ncbi:hypothetical protein V494_06142 [Pseudogymnoascus sp. VKM F-4513 (FW-928)]|nr:hypothetical protein V494_06142 [Pseudogymnoascus sp. VKM F-4513 (FW-928)]